MANLTDLRELDIFENAKSRGRCVSDTGVRHLASLKKLQKLHLIGAKITGQAFEKLDGLPELMELSLEHNPVTNLSGIGKLRQLRILRLSSTPVGDDGLGQLQGLQDLEWLALNGTNVTDAGMKDLARLKKLRMVELRNTAITGASLRNLAGLPELENLYLCESKIDDAAMGEVAGLQKLQILLIDGTRVTDIGLLKLTAIGGLRMVTISDCPGVTFEGIAKLKKVLPRCDVSGY